MYIMQRLDLTFTDDTQKSVIIHEYGDKFVMMITDDGWFRYFPEMINLRYIIQRMKHLKRYQSYGNFLKL